MPKIIHLRRYGFEPRKFYSGDQALVNYATATLEYRITTTWDSVPVLQRPMTLRFKSGVQGLLMEVNAPFFDDPLASPGEAGQAFYGLWEYEVFESLFLNSKTKQYLEVELCLHRQHLVLLLSSGDAFAVSTVDLYSNRFLFYNDYILKWRFK